MSTRQRSQDRIYGKGLTFDDVLLIPRASKVLPKDVSLRTKLANGIVLNVPIISAAMDTVTGSRMAIAMARAGCLGIIHKGMSSERQAAKVIKVKRSQSGQISKPFTLTPAHRLSDVRQMMEECGIGGIPIVDDNWILVGLITKRDIRFPADNDNPLVAEIMKPRAELIVAGPDTTLEQAEIILQQHRIEKLPLVYENGRLHGLFTYRDIQVKIDYPLASKDAKNRLLVGAAIGAGEDLAERTARLVEAGVDILCLDSSHGHAEGVVNAAVWVKNNFPSIPLIAGNVCTFDGAKALMDAGVDVIKVGVGPGSICTTRVVTGCGMPQLTAIMEAVEGTDATVPIIADGGIVYSGDITKALAAGAVAVMIGSLLAGTEEAPGDTITRGGRSSKVYRGMGSAAAMKQSGAERYFQEGQPPSKLVPEGIEAEVPLRGKVGEVIFQLAGGLRSGMGLVGASDLPALQTARFIQVTPAGFRESHPHDVAVTKEAPNYSFGGQN